jgi:hypothetical protein
MTESLCVETLRQILSCDFETGALTWKKRDVSMFNHSSQDAGRHAASWNSQFAGKVAFTSRHNKGYMRGVIFGEHYLAHRVVYALANGEWPKDQIDHKNGIRSDNRLVNIRSASRSENNRNAKVRTTNKSGVMGVAWCSRREKWRARIRSSSKQIHLGYFNCKSAAAIVRAVASAKHGYHENHGRIS